MNWVDAKVSQLARKKNNCLLLTLTMTEAPLSRAAAARIKAKTAIFQIKQLTMIFILFFSREVSLEEVSIQFAKERRAALFKRFHWDVFHQT